MTQEANKPLTSAELADLKAKAEGATPGEWELVPSTVHHGAYVCGPYGGDICDCYVMSKPGEPSTLNGGTSRPVPLMGTQMDANAAHIAAANPEAILRLIDMIERRDERIEKLRKTVWHFAKMGFDKAREALAAGEPPK